MQTQVIKVPASEADMIQAWLNLPKSIPDAGGMEIVKLYTAVFLNDIEVNIKVCNGDTGLYVDAVLLEAGNEIVFLEARRYILGTYYLRDTTEVYKVVVVKGE